MLIYLLLNVRSLRQQREKKTNRKQNRKGKKKEKPSSGKWFGTGTVRLEFGAKYVGRHPNGFDAIKILDPEEMGESIVSHWGPPKDGILNWISDEEDQRRRDGLSSLDYYGWQSKTDGWTNGRTDKLAIVFLSSFYSSLSLSPLSMTIGSRLWGDCYFYLRAIGSVVVIIIDLQIEPTKLVHQRFQTVTKRKFRLDCDWPGGKEAVVVG